MAEVRVTMIGSTLGHYKILEKIGSGGMGDVYLAEDATLDRTVALKVLPPELADESERRARFTREAKAVAALNHPNIVTVYSVEEAGGVHFITMELVRGRTLAAMLPRTGFALGKFFEIAIPLTEAVAAAHQHGITHRDLKPTNVMVSDDGRVKVLDFGLAKAGFDFSNRGGTLATRSATQEGHLVGTPAYMSPEQAEGKKVDPRSDIFSLGVVFYEMLTGQRPFNGGTAASILSSIIKDTPRVVSELKPAIPRELARRVHRCLAKDPIGRYQSAIDLRHDLEETRRDVESGDAIPSQPLSAIVHRSTKAKWGFIAAGLVAVAAIVWLVRDGEDSGNFAAPRLQNAFQVTSALDVESYPTWSPDGGRLAYQASDLGYSLVGDHDIWVAQLGSGEPVNLTNHSPANDRMPSWSPDGREIAFVSDRTGEWGIYLVPAIGGNARKVLDLPGIGTSIFSAPQWSNDGSKLFVSVPHSSENVVIVLSLESLATTRVVLPRHEGMVCHDLSVRPDGGRFAYVEGGPGAPDTTRLWTIPASGGEPVPLTDGRSNVRSPTWSNDGRTVFYVSNRVGTMDLWQQTVADDGRALGEPVALTPGLGIRTAVFSPDGRKLAYTRGGRVANVWRVPLPFDRPATWADATQLTSDHADIQALDVSPNGTFLALGSDRRGNHDLWLLPAAGGEMTQLTTDPTPDWNPRWSPDGKEIAFYAYRSGNRDIWVMPAQGGAARQLVSHPGQDLDPSWSPDGREIAFRSGGKSATLIVAAKGGEPRPLAAGFESRVEWWPDGRGLLIQREGRLYRVPRDGGEPLPLPLPPRTGPAPSLGRFSRDGQSLYYSVVTGPREDHDLWKLSLDDGKISRLTTLKGRRGSIGAGFATDERHLYFTWREDVGDIWVMDVVRDSTR